MVLPLADILPLHLLDKDFAHSGLLTRSLTQSGGFRFRICDHVVTNILDSAAFKLSVRLCKIRRLCRERRLENTEIKILRKKGDFDQF